MSLLSFMPLGTVRFGGETIFKLKTIVLRVDCHRVPRRMVKQRPEAATATNPTGKEQEITFGSAGKAYLAKGLGCAVRCVGDFQLRGDGRGPLKGGVA